MNIRLEKLPYQEIAIKSVVDVFKGCHKNSFDNAYQKGIRYNYCQLSEEDFLKNINAVLKENGIDKSTADVSADKELTIEMETGTGKTLVYVKTIYELFKEYGFTKFIILVPSVAIRQGILNTLQAFETQLNEIYGFTPNYFEYSSKRLSNVTNFISEQHPQIMIMTMASFDSEDKILNQTQREDLFANVPFIEAIGRTNPVIIMDEPQVGMDTENAVQQIAKLNPLCKIRYSATHKVVKNRLYRLTPFDSYKQGLVKKIEVLTVIEKNDEATLKLELAETKNGTGDPKAKIKAWVQSKSGKIEFKNTKWLKVGDNLSDATNNPSYLNYTIKRINKNLRTAKWTVSFTNDIELLEKERAGNIQNIWAYQLEWLIIKHFQKKQSLQEQNIKCLSLVFIDKVANYMSDEPIIKNLFVQKYKEIYPDFHDGKQATETHIEAIQGYYFAQTGKGEYTDSENSMRKNKAVFDAILKDKVGLLKYGSETANNIEFIFSHSALGVGWDNPNIFNIATLNNSYSDIKKRQEIGRGLRICVNQDGQRVYDKDNVADDERINHLTVIPNETYETFAVQYQEEIKAIYGTSKAGAGMSHSHKGKAQNEVHFKRNSSETINQAFKRFWKKVAQKTNYTVAFNEDSLIEKSIEAINAIAIADYEVEISSRSITSISEDGIENTFEGTESHRQKAYFSALDLVEEISENTGIGYITLLKIIDGITNYDDFTRNPPQYVHQASAIIKNIELDEMYRELEYSTTGESFPFSFDDFVKNIPDKNIVETPKRGVFDKMRIDSDVERTFAKKADFNDQVVCFLKLPSYYKIDTPIGSYNPDFGIVMKRKELRNDNETEFYFVIETKGTNDINDKKSLTPSEVYKIKCAIKHFAKLGVDVHYTAPVKEFDYFEKQAKQVLNNQ